MRRNVGLSSLSRRDESIASYTSLSSSITDSQLKVLSAQMSTFQTGLRNFASKHRSAIARDPVFREQFSRMCSDLGVDPLGGGQKGFWHFLGVGEWTYSLAVQVVDVCVASRERNGGLLEMDELVRAVNRLRVGDVTEARQNGIVTSADIVQAIRSLEPLECGYAVLDVGGRKMIRSVPAEFDLNSLVLLECATASGTAKVTFESLARFTEKKEGVAWSVFRIAHAIDRAVTVDGVLWVDDQAQPTQYWVAAFVDFGG